MSYTKWCGEQTILTPFSQTSKLSTSLNQRLKFYIVWFSCMRSWGLSIYIETKLQITCFMIFEKIYFSYDILLTDQTSLSGCLYDVGYVHCNCGLTRLERHEINLIFIIFLFFLVLGQLPSKKIPTPNPKTNPNLNPNPYQRGGWGKIFLGGSCLVAPQP